MKSVSRLSALLIVFLFVALMAPVGAVSAHDGEEHEPVKIAQEENQDQDKEEAVTYEYVAQAGDSYTLIARKAVQTYGLKEDVSLSAGQIIFAETRLTKAAGSPELSIGQEVSVDESEVKKWVEEAQELSEEREALWNEYAEGVDFNTDNVGENREANDTDESEDEEDSEENEESN